MDARVEKVLILWHKHFEDEESHYAEFEPSDIEYFVGCMLYNHFAFSKAHPNMKTIDLSYDFLQSCGDANYAQAQELISEIEFGSEEEALAFLQEYLETVRSKYNKSERYLLDRLDKHVRLMAERYEKNEDPNVVDFKAIYKMK